MDTSFYSSEIQPKKIYMLFWKGYYYPYIGVDYIYGIFDTFEDAKKATQNVQPNGRKLFEDGEDYEIKEFVVGNVYC